MRKTRNLDHQSARTLRFLSPFRYPGGKTWLLPIVRRWLASLSPPVEELIEPFAGGASVGLMAAFEGFARKVVLVEIDPQVASVWKTILRGDGRWLARRILRFKVSGGSVKGVLTGPKSSLRERGFATLLRNRVQRAGILAPAAGLMKKGEDGRGLQSRWYPETLSKRILSIANKRKRIRFIQGDGIEFLREYDAPERTALFLDPPYMVAGKRLYEYSDVDHQTLFAVARQFAGKVLMTYNNVSAIRTIAEEFGFQTRVVRMKNSHNRMKKELLISDSMEWFE